MPTTWLFLPSPLLLSLPYPRPGSSTYLLHHCTGDIEVGFVRERHYHVVDIFPALGPHVS